MLREYVIFKDRMFGEPLKAKNFNDLLNRMNKKQKRFWTNVKYIDIYGDTINIQRKYVEKGISIDKIIFDWKINNRELLRDKILII